MALADEPASPSGDATRQSANSVDDRALAVATALIKAQPSAEGYQHRAMIESRLDRHAEALADLDAAIKLAPQDAAAYARRGDEHFFLARFKDALADYDRQISLAPDSGPGHWQRGIACYVGLYYDMTGKKELAISHLRDAERHRIDHFMWQVARVHADLLDKKP